VRIGVGLFFVGSGLPKIVDHAAWAAEFTRWDVPLAGAAAYLVGTAEIVGGALLAAGVATRLVAGAFVALMVGAVLVAGTRDGGDHLVLPPILGVLGAFLLVRGGGAWQLLPDPRSVVRRVARRRVPRSHAGHPG
jgi:uncharacterized membrane protein YphA (DoxX/SURF4 family)